MNNQNQKGNSLIEVLAVLAIISCASVGLYAGISKAYSRFRLTKGVFEATSSIKTLRDYFSSAPPSNLTTETLVDIGVLNAYYDNEKKYAVNFLGQKSEIKISGEGAGKYASDFAASGDPTFRLYYYDVRPQECVDLLLSDWGHDVSSGLVEISTGIKTFRWPKDHGSGSYSTLPPELENVHSACIGEEDTVTIYWEYFF